MAKSVKSIAAKALKADESARKKAKISTADSFVNFQQKLGVGADNPLTSSGYGFNPISRLRAMLEWIHRGSWLGGVAVDLVANDMTRAGASIISTLKPDQVNRIEESMVSLGVWNAVTDTVKWARLYGGSIGIMMIDGQDYSKPLRIETVAKGQFKGIYSMDRWMVEPSLSNLVTDPGPNLGLPKFYRVTTDAPALSGANIHYSRVIRLEGISLPYWQRIQENLWGISVLERLYDRMIAFDSATTGAAQLIYKAYIRTYKVDGLREVIASGGELMDGMVRYVEMMRRFQGIEGITLLDAKDSMETMGHSAFSGISEALLQFGQQLSGALQIPLVRLFGQSPAGMNSTGESDLRMYYDGINQQQNQTLLVPMTQIYRMVAQSEGIQVPEGFKIRFRPLWQLTEREKADIASTITGAVRDAEDSGLISQQTAMKELKHQAEFTEVFGNITEEDIAAAEEELPPPGMESTSEGEGEEGSEEGGSGSEGPSGASGEIAPKAPTVKAPKAPTVKAPAAPKVPKVKDSIGSVTGMKQYHGLDVVIENSKGSLRRGQYDGKDWEVSMPADYGYVRKTLGADGDQVDCYIGPSPSSKDVWVIDQLDIKTRQFDEHKCMLGYETLQDAISDYVSGYSDGRGFERVMNLRHMSMDEFKIWLAN